MSLLAVANSYGTSSVGSNVQSTSLLWPAHSYESLVCSEEEEAAAACCAAFQLSSSTPFTPGMATLNEVEEGVLEGWVVDEEEEEEEEEMEEDGISSEGVFSLLSRL